MLNLDSAINYALRRLENELSPKLTYHSLIHTQDEVVPAVTCLAEMEGVKELNFTLLLTAAYFHDIGFIIRRQEHEIMSVKIAAEVLPQFDYSEMNIRQICSIIMATRLPQSPQTLVERIMADGDLDGFGQINFFQRSLDLRNELAFFDVVSSDLTWYTNQFTFVSSHNYFTSSAHLLRDAQKVENLRQLARLIEDTRQKLL